MICKIEGCSGIYKARGLCRTHYSRWLIHGDPRVNLRNKNPICMIADCTNKTVAKGLCDKHYTRLRVHGDPNTKIIKKKGDCSVENCFNIHHCKSYCMYHYNKFKYYGNPSFSKTMKTQCKILDCGGKIVAHCYCNKHYRLWVRYGRPDFFNGKIKQKTPKLELEFNKLKENNGLQDVNCWLWNKHINQWGYGTVTYKGKKSTLVHRASYNYFISTIPEGLLVCHKCDVPACFNPNHLFIGTNYDNVQDCIKKKRHWFNKSREQL